MHLWIYKEFVWGLISVQIFKYIHLIRLVKIIIYKRFVRMQRNVKFISYINFNKVWISKILRIQKYCWLSYEQYIICHVSLVVNKMEGGANEMKTDWTTYYFKFLSWFKIQFVISVNTLFSVSGYINITHLSRVPFKMIPNKRNKLNKHNKNILYEIPYMLKGWSVCTSY